MSAASISATYALKDGVTGNMISGAAQHHKRRPTVLRKTVAMQNAERHNGDVLDEIWRVGALESFQIIPSTSQNANGKAARSARKSSRVSGGSISGTTTMTTGSYCQRAATAKLMPKSNTSPHGGIAIECDPSTSADEKADGLGGRTATGASCLAPIPAAGSAIQPMSNFVRLNIGGTLYLLLIDAIVSADQSGFLAKFVHLSHPAREKVADAYLSLEDAYYFQRSPLAFEPIFQYYATGVVHRPAEMCSAQFAAELEFWRISSASIAACCTDDISGPAKSAVDEEDKFDDTTFEKLICGKLRRRMWTFLERPGSSFQAKAFELSSTLFVIISVMGLSFGTIPEFQITERVKIGQNETVRLPDGTTSMKEIEVEVRTEHPAFIFTERICIAFFTIEYCLRMFVAPRKLRFMFKPLNLVDLLAVLPFYLELILTLCGVDDRKLRDLRWAFLVVRILRVLRVIRIIKLGRFSSGLQTFGMTLQRSQKQLQMMTIVLLTGVVFFSTMIYFLEKDEPGTPFTSIPAAYWWCIVTMTTVGYGDVVPVTTMGKVIASAAIMSGVLVLALPITIIVDNFIKVAQDEQQAEQCKEFIEMEHHREEGDRQQLLRDGLKKGAPY